jgi:peptidase S41-like protein
MRRVFLASLFLFLMRATVTPEEARQWREDLHFAAAEMEKMHKNLFHSLTREQFASMVSALDAKIPTLARHQIIVEMAKIVAAVGDGHTNIAPTRDPKIGFRTLPVAFYFFEDGLYIRAAHRSQANLLGGRVVGLGNSDINAYNAVKQMISRDNAQGVLYWAPQFLVMPEVLHALGIIDDMENVRITIERGGKRESFTLLPLGLAEMMPPDTDMTWNRRADWIDARGESDPLWLQDAKSPARMEVLAGTKTLYVQLNQISDQLTKFAEAMRQKIESDGIDRLILDLRLNRGGNGDYNVPVLRAIIQSQRIDQDGRLFCIIGRGTFSAAQSLANQLERYTHVTFVGERSGSKGNAFGDSRKIILPNSGITVRASIFYWQEWFPLDTRDATIPKIAAPLTFDDYRRNVDPALEAISSAKSSSSAPKSEARSRAVRQVY